MGGGLEEGSVGTDMPAVVCCLLGLGQLVVDGNWCVRASGGRGATIAESTAGGGGGVGEM